MMIRRHSSVWSAPVAIVIVMATAAVAVAQSTTTFAPSVTVSTAHDDNVYSSVVPVADFLTVLRPTLESRHDAPRLLVRSVASVDLQRTARGTLPIALNARRHADAEAKGRLTSALTLSGAAAYDRTESASDLTQDTGVLLARQRASRFHLTPSVTYQVSPQTEFAAQYGWTHQTLAGSMSSWFEVAQTGVRRQLSPRLTWGAKYLGRRFGDVTGTRRSHAGLLGLTRALSPATTVSVEGGPRATASGGLAPELAAGLTRRGGRTRLLLDYWRGESSVLGTPGAVEVQSATARTATLVRPRLELGSAVGVFRTGRIDTGVTSVYHASAVGTWSPGPVAVGVSYGLDYQRGSLRAGPQAPVRRRVFLVSLTVMPKLPRRNPVPDRDQPTTPLRGRLP